MWDWRWPPSSKAVSHTPQALSSTLTAVCTSRCCETHMIAINPSLTPASLLPAVERLIALSGEKIRLMQRSWDPARGTPVFTVRGVYTSRGWTEWTQGFQFGSVLLQYDLTG